MIAPTALHVLEADLRTRASAMIADLLTLADPAEPHRADLRAHGVAPATVTALYPVELADVIGGWRTLLGDQALLAACNPPLVERQFESAMRALPWSLANSLRTELEVLGLNDEAKWAGAFAVAAHELSAEWLTYQFGHLFIFLHALTTAPTLEPEIFMPLGNTPDPEFYDSAWRMLGKWVAECETVTAQLARTASERVPCQR